MAKYKDLVSPEAVKEVRLRTKADLLMAKRALEHTSNDVNLAIKHLLETKKVNVDMGEISRNAGRPTLDDRKKVKSHRITISLNDEEYENLVSYKDFLGKSTIASTINHLMDEGKQRINEKAQQLASLKTK